MANRNLKRYGLENIAKALIIVGLLLILFSWVLGVYYLGNIGKPVLFIVPFIFTCILAVMLLFIRYRYTLFEKYPYLMNLPSLFYRIKDKQGSNSNQSVAFSMIFTVHALIAAFLGLLSVVLTISIGSSVHGSSAASPFLYTYLAIVAILIISVLLQYRRIYLRFAK